MAPKSSTKSKKKQRAARDLEALGRALGGVQPPPPPPSLRQQRQQQEEEPAEWNGFAADLEGKSAEELEAILSSLQRRNAELDGPLLEMAGALAQQQQRSQEQEENDDEGACGFEPGDADLRSRLGLEGNPSAQMEALLEAAQGKSPAQLEAMLDEMEQRSEEGRVSTAALLQEKASMESGLLKQREQIDSMQSMLKQLELMKGQLLSSTVSATKAHAENLELLREPAAEKGVGGVQQHRQQQQQAQDDDDDDDDDDDEKWRAKWMASASPPPPPPLAALNTNEEEDAQGERAAFAANGSGRGDAEEDAGARGGGQAGDARRAPEEELADLMELQKLLVSHAAAEKELQRLTSQRDKHRAQAKELEDTLRRSKMEGGLEARRAPRPE